MNNLPRITIMTGTFNSNIPLFKKVLESVKMQVYSKNLIEHIVFDKGSTNGCVDLAKRYGCRVILRKESAQNQQASAALGILMAKGDVILVLESDNILIGKDWLSKMVKPFMENKKIFCTFSAYNTYEKNMSATTRYCGLFGSPEPTLYYLDKSEKIPLIQKKYNKGEVIKEEKDYYVVKFKKENLPTLGDNGHMFSKKVMGKIIKDPDDYIHVDAFARLLELGYDTFGVVKNKIIHVQNPNITAMVKRRIEIKGIFYDGRRGKRKYLVMNWRSGKDLFNLLKYILLSITVVVPLLESFRGYIKIKDRAWFLHPILCFLMVSGYGWSEIKWKLRNH